MPNRKTGKPGTHKITQGHPTYAEPDLNKGGQAGAPQPAGKATRDGGVSLPEKIGKANEPSS